MQAKTTKPTPKPGPSTSKPSKSSSAAPEAVVSDVISADPRFSQMIQTVQAASDVGEVKVQLKPQNKRASIAVLMFKEVGGTKFSQKLQIVVKPPALVGVDAMAILKDIAADLLDGDLKLDDLKQQRDNPVEKHEMGTLIDYFKERRPISQEENALFVGIYAKRLALGIELSSDRQPDSLPAFGLPDIELPGHLSPDRFLACTYAAWPVPLFPTIFVNLKINGFHIRKMLF